MNNVQRATMMLGIILGEPGRAVWMAHRVDGLPLWRIADDMEVPIGKVTEILKTADFVLESLPWSELTGDAEEREYKAAVGGFHNLEE